jgi:hypothetical protein
VSIVWTDCRGCRLFVSGIEIYIFEISDRSRVRLQVNWCFFVLVIIFGRPVSVVKTDCREFMLYFCVIVIFICRGTVLCEDRLQEIYTMFCVIVIYICESIARGEDSLQRI